MTVLFFCFNGDEVFFFWKPEVERPRDFSLETVLVMREACSLIELVDWSRREEFL